VRRSSNLPSFIELKELQHIAEVKNAIHSVQCNTSYSNNVVITHCILTASAAERVEVLKIHSSQIQSKVVLFGVLKKHHGVTVLVDSSATIPLVFLACVCIHNVHF
jgi:hypothetical protein